jgi:MoaA/NifB/PqqE/SkfB family radical SAM enzyme
MRRLTPATEEAVRRLIGRALEARQKADGRPFIVGHFITYRCMCKCASCLWRDNDCEDVPLRDLERFYAEAKEEGFVATAFSGGEPFLRKDLGDLVRFIKEQAGMSILLFNTGWHLKKRIDEVLPHIDMMIVSLDSAKPERHDEIRGLPGLFDRAVEGVRLVKENYPDVSLQFNCCVQKGIADEIDDLLDLSQRLGVKISFDVITEYRNGENGPFAETDRGMDLPELQGVCASLVEKKRAGAPILNSEQCFSYFVEGKPGYACHMPKLVMFVDGWGNVEYCLNLDRPLANIREMPLKEIMELERFKQLRVEAEGCCSCNSPTMLDLSKLWENPALAFEEGGIAVG